MENHLEQADICCTPFDPQPWNEQTHEWVHKRFISDSVNCFLNIPLNFGTVMRRLDRKMTESEAAVPDYLCLSEQISPWKMNVYLAIDKEIPNAATVALSGHFYSQVFEGPYKELSNWQKQFRLKLINKGLPPQNVFTWFTTCPSCAKKYGKNYLVLFAKIA